MAFATYSLSVVLAVVVFNFIVWRCAGSSRLEMKDQAWIHRCNIETRPYRSPLQAGSAPYVVQLPKGTNSALSHKLGRNHLLDQMGDASCTPSQAANSRGSTFDMKLREYVDEWMNQDVNRDPSRNRYVFGEFGDQWAPLREAYNRPPCGTCHGDNASVTIGLGGLYSGAPWHFHGAAFVEVLHGAKHFALLPPGHAAEKVVQETIGGLSQVHWHHEVRLVLERQGLLDGMLECTLQPGDLLYFPNLWYHGIVNMNSYTAFVSTFVQQETSTTHNKPVFYKTSDRAN